MRAMFWQRKNARLTARLNTLVETSERVSKSRRRKPRVVIDQTYAQSAQDEPDHSRLDQDGASDTADAASGRISTSSDETQGNPDTRSEDNSSEFTDGHELGHADGIPDEESEENAILHEAIDQLDQAEQREAEALQEIDRLRTQLQEQLETQKSATETKDAPARNRTSSDAQGHELSAARNEISRLQSLVEQETAARTAAQAERDQAIDAVEAVQNDGSEASTRETILNAELEVLRRELSAEKAARETIEGERDQATALISNNESNQQSSAATSNEVAMIRAEADARIAVARREADTQRRLMDKLQKELIVVQTAREMTEAQLLTSSGASVGQQDELKSALAARVDAEKRLSETEAAEQKLQQQCETLSKQLAQHQAAVQTAQQERDELLARAETAETSLAETANLSTELEQANQRAEEVQAQLSSSRDDVSRLQTNLAETDERATLAEQRARETEEELADLRKIAARNEIVENARDEAISRVETVQREADELRAEVTKLNTAATETRIALVEADERATLAEQRTSETDDELASLRKTEALYAQALKAQEKADQGAEMQAEKTRAEIDAQAAQITQLTSEVTSLQERIANTDDELTSLRETAAQHAEAVATAQEASARADAATGEQHAQAERIAQLTSEITDLREHKQETEARAAQAEAKRNDIERELGELRASSRQEEQSDERVTRLKAAEKKVKEELEDQNRKLAEVTTQVSEMRLRLTETDKKKSEAEQRCKEMAAELTELRAAASNEGSDNTRDEQTKAELAKAQQAADEQRIPAEELHKSIEQLQASLTSADEKAAQAASRADAAEQELASFRDTASSQPGDKEGSADPDPDARKEEFEALHAELEQLRTALVQAQDDRDDANAHAEDLQNELAAADTSTAEAGDAEGTTPAGLPNGAGSTTEPSVEQAGQIKDAAKQAAGPLAKPNPPAEDFAHSLGRVPPVAAVSTLAMSAAMKSDPQPTISQSPAPATGGGAPVGTVQNRINRALTPKEQSQEARRARRLSSRKVAQLWQEGMSTALSCTMQDRSSTGAKLEIMTDRFNDRMNDIEVGDRYTLSVTYAQERTSMVCEIMWVSGRECGVKFCGQIHTEVIKAAKKSLPRKEPEKPSKAKKFSSLFRANTK